MSVRRVRVIGTGLIGTSLGLSLREAAARGSPAVRGVEVLLEDSHPGHLRTAIALGAGVLDDGKEADVTFVAVPPAQAGPVAAGVLGRDLNSIVSDTTSIKARPQLEVESLCWDQVHRFVGGHPIAGRERSGPAAARADLFRGRAWVLTAPDSPQRRVVQQLVEACGAVAIFLDPNQHDQAVAVSSHLPQLVASTLAGSLAELPQTSRAVVGGGFADMTRVADSDPELWAEIAAGNQGPLGAALRRFAARLDSVADALEGPNPQQAVRELVESGRQGRRLLPGKHGGPAHEYVSVGVVVRDEPGELGRLFAAAGSAGVNIEDVRVDHAPGLPLGAVELAVAAGAAARLRATLSAQGWTLDD